MKKFISKQASKQASKGIRLSEKMLALLTLFAMTMPSYTSFAATSLEDSKGLINMDDDGSNIGIDINQSETTNYNKDIAITSDSSDKTKVYVTQSSTFNAIIPKTIVLNGANGEENSGTYEIKTKANIAANEYIIITPSANTFNMTQEGKKDIVATITQEKSLFKVSGMEMFDEMM